MREADPTVGAEYVAAEGASGKLAEEVPHARSVLIIRNVGI